MTGAEGQAWGYFNDVVPKDKLLEKANAMRRSSPMARCSAIT